MWTAAAGNSGEQAVPVTSVIFSSSISSTSLHEPLTEVYTWFILIYTCSLAKHHQGKQQQEAPDLCHAQHSQLLHNQVIRAGQTKLLLSAACRQGQGQAQPSKNTPVCYVKLHLLPIIKVTLFIAHGSLTAHPATPREAESVRFLQLQALPKLWPSPLLQPLRNVFCLILSFTNRKTGAILALTMHRGIMKIGVSAAPWRQEFWPY